MSDNPVPGNPAAIDNLGTLLSRLGADLDSAGVALKGVDTGTFSGATAEAMRANYLNCAPADWLTAADAATAVSSTLHAFGQTLADAQRRAASAQADLTAAQQTAPIPPGGAPAGSNPALDQANAELVAAQQMWQQAGKDAAAAVRAATAVQATVQVSWGDKLGSFAKGFGSGLLDYGKMLMMPLTGAIGGIGYIAQTVSAASAFGKDPGAFLGHMIDLPTWQTNPAQAAGRLIPNAVALLAGGVEGIAGKVAGVGGRVGEEAGATESRIGEAAKAGEEKPPLRPEGEQPDPATQMRNLQSEQAELTARVKELHALPASPATEAEIVAKSNRLDQINDEFSQMAKAQGVGKQ